MKRQRVKQTEAQVKKAVEEYLKYGENQGKWIFHRLQCGSRLIDYGDHKQKIQFCEAGTADYEVIQGKTDHEYWNHPFPFCVVTYLEIKSTTGKQSPDQVAFCQKAMKQNCRYYIVRDASLLEEILK